MQVFSVDCSLSDDVISKVFNKSLGYLIAVFILPAIPAIVWRILYLRAVRQKAIGRALVDVHRADGTRLRDLAIRMLLPMPEEDSQDFPRLDIKQWDELEQEKVAAAAVAAAAAPKAAQLALEGIGEGQGEDGGAAAEEAALAPAAAAELESFPPGKSPRGAATVPAGKAAVGEAAAAGDGKAAAASPAPKLKKNPRREHEERERAFIASEDPRGQACVARPPRGEPAPGEPPQAGARPLGQRQRRGAQERRRRSAARHPR